MIAATTALDSARSCGEHRTMPPRHRRSALRVRGGRVAKKNSWRVDPGDFWTLPQDEVRIDRRAPGDGCRHLITVDQLRAFIELLPDWDEVAIGLDAIVLDAYRGAVLGWYQRGVVAVCAWERSLWWPLTARSWIEENRSIFERLDVEWEALTREQVLDRLRPGKGPMSAVPVPDADRWCEIRWTEAQARAFQLLDVLPHELGHHHDRITTHRQLRTGRGEPYAGHYAQSVANTVWDTYATTFGT
jgi:hypothetical protein